MDDLNRSALELVEAAIDFAEELGIGVYELENRATVLDFGHENPGGIEAGIRLAEIQTAGLATVGTRMDTLDGVAIPHVELETDWPTLSLLCSQTAAWRIDRGEFSGLASGPARALVEGPFTERVGYREESEFATLTIESETLPGESIAEHVADRTGLEPESVFLIGFPTGSRAGTVAAAARAAELALVRLADLGYGPGDVRSAVGSAPIAPVCEESLALARTNDALAYGGQVHLTVETDDDCFAELPSTASETYGEPFETIMDGTESEALPTELFAPAEATIDVVDGPIYTTGERDEATLAEGFGVRRL